MNQLNQLVGVMFPQVLPPFAKGGKGGCRRGGPWSARPAGGRAEQAPPLRKGGLAPLQQVRDLQEGYHLAIAQDRPSAYPLQLGKRPAQRLYEKFVLA
jgi:hypothetical protein